MEQIKKDKIITHRLHSIQFTDEAIENLKWNKRTEKRQRIRVRLKNAPKGISLRWSPKTNKKVFELIFIYNKKTHRHDCGEFTHGVFTCSALEEYLTKLNAKHKNKDGTYKTNPNVSLITKDQLNKSQKKTVRQVIELICKDNFPRKNIRGNLSALSIKDHTRFLIGYNERREQLTFEDNDKGWGQIIFKETSNIKDWNTLFKTYPKGVGCYEGENSVYDSYLGDVIIDDLLPGNIEIYLNEINRSYGQRENIRRALAYLWAYARKKGLMGPNPPINNPARKEEGGITIEKDEESRFLGSKYNELSFDKDQLNEIDKALISLKDKYPFQSECLRMMLHTGMRAEEFKILFGSEKNNQKQQEKNESYNKLNYHIFYLTGGRYGGHLPQPIDYVIKNKFFFGYGPITKITFDQLHYYLLYNTGLMSLILFNLILLFLFFKMIINQKILKPNILLPTIMIYLIYLLASFGGPIYFMNRVNFLFLFMMIFILTEIDKQNLKKSKNAK